MTVGLVLAAAGGGTRLGGVPKQVRPLCGRPVICWSIERFIGLVDEVVIVTSDKLKHLVTSLLEAEQITIPYQIVSGGASRLESVACGINALTDQVDRVLVHDAARPLVKPAEIEQCIRALDTCRAVVLSSACTATVKQCNGSSIEATVDRSNLWLAQTPQAFYRVDGMKAFSQAITELDDNPRLGDRFTDDVSVLDWFGIPGEVVTGSSTNIKITTSDDWSLAEALLNHENEQRDY